MALLWVICTMICNFVQTTVHLEDFADAAFVSEQAFIWLSKIARFLVILAVNFCSIISQNNYWRDASNLTNFTVSYPGAIGKSAQGTVGLALPSSQHPMRASYWDAWVRNCPFLYPAPNHSLRKSDAISGAGRGETQGGVWGVGGCVTPPKNTRNPDWQGNQRNWQGNCFHDLAN